MSSTAKKEAIEASKKKRKKVTLMEKVKPQKNLFVEKGFLHYYENQLATDMLIRCDGKEYKTHQLLIAHASGYFHNILKKSTEPVPLIDVTLRDSGEVEIFPTVIRYMYSGKMDFSADNAIPLLSIADRFSMKDLKKIAAEYIGTNIERENAMEMLKKAMRFNVSEMVSTCVDVLGKNFCFIFDADWNLLPPDLFVQVLQHPQLAVTTEYDLYKKISKYIEAHPQITSEQAQTMMGVIRFRWLSYAQMKEVASNELVPRQLLVTAMLGRWKTEDEPSSKELGDDQINSPRPRQGLEFKYRFWFDQKQQYRGMINWIATDGGRIPWSNPHVSNKIKVTASSVEKGLPQNIVGRTPTELWTKDVPASWFAIDLGKDRRAMPNYYTIRHGGNYKGESMRTWDFQGSIDGSNWCILRRHSNDVSLNKPFAMHSWPIQYTDENIKVARKGFRYFRLLQTGHNSSNHNYLAASGIELYGQLYDDSLFAERS